MEERLADTLMDASNVVRWFEQYRLANALVLLARLLRARRVHTLNELEKWVEEEESWYQSLHAPA